MSETSQNERCVFVRSDDIFTLFTLSLTVCLAVSATYDIYTLKASTVLPFIMMYEDMKEANTSLINGSKWI